jgi:ADP-ribose pyrophosphatase YjhB (NUDIX family)
MNGRIEAIYTAPAEALPVIRRTQVHARPSVGLDGDRYTLGTGFWSRDHKVSRDVTLIEAEVIEALRDERGGLFDHGSFRRNIVTRGVKLNELVGKRFRIGELVLEGTSLCEPCAYLERLVGRSILQALVHRGGLRANILTIGNIRCDDEISLDVPQVGVGVLARRAGKYLLGLRRGTKRGCSTWSIPGGSVARAETVLGCAVRELREETGLHGEFPRVVSQAFNRLEDGCEWQSVFVAVDVPPATEPEPREPEKCTEWGWFEPRSLPEPLFAPVGSILRSRPL